MFRKLVWTYTLCFILITVQAQQPEWIRTYQVGDQFTVKQFASDNHGNVYTFASTNLISQNSCDIKKINAENGDVIWQQKLSGLVSFGNSFVDANGDIYLIVDGFINKISGINGQTIWTGTEVFVQYTLAFNNKLVAIKNKERSSDFEIKVLSAEYGFEWANLTLNANAFVNSKSLWAKPGTDLIFSYSFSSSHAQFNVNTFGPDQVPIDHKAGIVCFDDELRPRWCIPGTSVISFTNIFFDTFSNLYVFGSSPQLASVGLGANTFTCNIFDRSILFKVDVLSGNIIWHKIPAFEFGYNPVAQCDQRGRLEIFPIFNKAGGVIYDALVDIRLIDPTECDNDEHFTLSEYWHTENKLHGFDSNDALYAFTSFSGEISVEGQLIKAEGLRDLLLLKRKHLETTSLFKCGFETLKLFPNPAHNQITISFEQSISPDFKISVYDALGIKKLELTNETYYQLDLSNWSSGIYVLEAIDNAGQRIIKKFIKAGED